MNISQKSPNRLLKMYFNASQRFTLLLSILIGSLIGSIALADETPLVNYYETPLQAILTENAFAEHQELATISLTQTLNRVESPDEARVTLIQSGFLDDSIEGTKEVYQLRLTPNGWVIEDKETYIKCYRGPNTTEYLEQICL